LQSGASVRVQKGQIRPLALVEPHASFTFTSRHRDGNQVVALGPMLPGNLARPAAKFSVFGKNPEWSGEISEHRTQRRSKNSYQCLLAERRVRLIWPERSTVASDLRGHLCRGFRFHQLGDVEDPLRCG
jgi:hypothetical protein